MCGGIARADVWDERYELNHCSDTEEMPNQVKDDGVGWSGREYHRQLIDQEHRGKRLVA